MPCDSQLLHRFCRRFSLSELMNKCRGSSPLSRRPTTSSRTGSTALTRRRFPSSSRLRLRDAKYGMGLIFHQPTAQQDRRDGAIAGQQLSDSSHPQPNDQKYIRDVVETMGEDEARALPNLNTGEALLSGLFTRIPVMVRVEKSISEARTRKRTSWGTWPTTKRAADGGGGIGQAACPGRAGGGAVLGSDLGTCRRSGRRLHGWCSAVRALRGNVELFRWRH